MNNDTTETPVVLQAAAASSAVFDISNLDAVKYSEEGVDVPILNPRTQEPTGIVIQVQGAFGSRFKEMMSRNKKREALRQKNSVARAVAAASGDTEDDAAEVLAEVTLGWYTVTKDKEGNETRHSYFLEKGQSVPFSKAEARRVYELYPVIRGQVLAAALDVANFTRG